MGKLIGRLSFARSAIFARFARSLLAPLNRKLKSMAYTPELPHEERIVLTAWPSFLGRPCAKLRKPFCSLPEFMLYTDVSLKGDRGVLADILSKTQGKKPLPAEFAISNKAPSILLGCFRESSQIYGLEFFAILAAIFQLKGILRGRPVTIFRDNESAAQALAKGGANHPPAAAMIAQFWLFPDRYSISIWIERVSSGDNLADLPTRDRNPPIPIRKGMTFFPAERRIRLFPIAYFSQ